MQAWETQDQTLTWPVAAPLERCAELLGVELAAVAAAAAHVEPYLRVDGTKIWSLTQLERHLHPDAYGPPSSRCLRSGPGWLHRPSPATSHRRLSPSEDAMAERCSFCGATGGPFSTVGGLFTVLMCADCLATRGHGAGPYPVMTRAEMRAGLELLPTWALEQKAAANRQVIAVMRERLAAGEQVARMYQEPGLAWLERQAETAEELITERRNQGQQVD